MKYLEIFMDFNKGFLKKNIFLNTFFSRQAYLIRELFPNGPRQVTAVLSNQKNGITLLIAWRSVYRYRWNKKNKRFYVCFLFQKNIFF